LWCDESKVSLSQTTFSVDETIATVERLRHRFPSLQDPPSDDICYATQNRQAAVKALAPECDLVIVVGSQNSSNSIRLVGVARQAGVSHACRVRHAGEIDLRWLDDVLPLQMQSMVSYMASRTAFFDQFFLDATRVGIRQAVILAAGLDSRSWRLRWPGGTTVYELDQPRVLDFKLSTLADHGSEPACNRVAVSVDLRQDWPTALQQAGFDPSAPSVWSAEGLMPYLPAAAQELLFDRVQGLTVAGSRVAVEALGPKFLDADFRAKHRERMDRIRALMAKVDPDREILKTDGLWYFEEREDVGDWFRRHGWDVTVTPADELMAGYGRRAPKDVEHEVPGNLFMAAQRT
jgi:methyltransferase (TIGR00027 family)